MLNLNLTLCWKQKADCTYLWIEWMISVSELHLYFHPWHRRKDLLSIMQLRDASDSKQNKWNLLASGSLLVYIQLHCPKAWLSICQEECETLNLKQGNVDRELAYKKGTRCWDCNDKLIFIKLGYKWWLPSLQALLHLLLCTQGPPSHTELWSLFCVCMEIAHCHPLPW